MAVYRLTRFAALDTDKAEEIAERMRSEIEGIRANFIDLVSYGNCKSGDSQIPR